uniref:Nitric oxide synthase-interacting protein homolog n=1 Tax=Meloidogyne javanica TaxID=6303 RepID=A0A915N6T8_MELJA
MTRHAKNATAASVYTYHERRKDASVSGYGTLHERLGKDSMKSFDCCSLSLQPCREPLISPQGHIFDREAILNYILDQKEAYKRKLKALKKEKDKMKEKLIALESAPLPQKTQVPSTPDVRQLKRPQNDKMEGPSNSKKVFEEESISNMEGAKAKEWKSFWVPVLSTTAEPDRIEKPSNKILCPISGVELKFKELLPVKFTPIDERIEFSKLIAMNERYICPISRDVLTNSIRCVYLKTSKSVVCSPCMEKIIRLDMIDPLCGKSLQDSDIIELSRGGTGYAATNDLKAKLIRPQLELQ